MPIRSLASALLLFCLASPTANAEQSADIEAQMQRLMSYDMREYMAEHGAHLPDGQHIDGDQAQQLTRGGTFMLQMRFGQDDKPEIHLIRTQRQAPQPTRRGQEAFARFTSAEMSIDTPAPISPIRAVDPRQKPVPPRQPEPPQAPAQPSSASPADKLR